MGTTETSRGAGGAGAARMHPAQEAVAPPSPAASPSPERRVAQPTASPEARTAWPSVPLTSPAVNRPPGDTSARINVRDAVVPDPSPSSPPNEASPAIQPGPPRAATPALVRKPSLPDLSHPVSASSDDTPGATRILVASPDADHTVSSPAKDSVSAASPGEQALPHPSPTRVRVASPEPDAPATKDTPGERSREETSFATSSGSAAQQTEISDPFVSAPAEPAMQAAPAAAQTKTGQVTSLDTHASTPSDAGRPDDRGTAAAADAATAATATTAAEGGGAGIGRTDITAVGGADDESGEAKTASPPFSDQPSAHPGSERTMTGDPDPATDTLIAAPAEALGDTSTREGPIHVLENGQYVSELYHGGPERYLELQPDIEAIVTDAYERQIIARVGEQHAPLYIQDAQQYIKRILDQIHDNFYRNDTNIVLLRERRGNGFVGFTYSFTNAHSPQTAEIGTTVILEEYRGLGGMDLMMENLNHGIAINGNYTEIMQTVPQANGYAQRVMDHVRRESGDVTILSTDTRDRWFGAQTIFAAPVPTYTAKLAGLEAATALAERRLSIEKIADYATTIDVLGRECLQLILTGDRESAAQIGGIIQSLLQYTGGQANQVLEGVVQREKLMQLTKSDGYRTAQGILTEHFERHVSPEDPAYAMQRAYHEAFMHYLESRAIGKHIAETKVDRIRDYILDPVTGPKRVDLWTRTTASSLMEIFTSSDLTTALLNGGVAVIFAIAAGRFEWKTWKKEKALLDRARQEAQAEDINSINTNFFGYWEPYHRLAAELVDAKFDITEEDLAEKYSARIRDGLTLDHVLYQTIMGSRDLASDPATAMDEITRRLQWVVTFADESFASTPDVHGKDADLYIDILRYFNSLPYMSPDGADLIGEINGSFKTKRPLRYTVLPIEYPLFSKEWANAWRRIKLRTSVQSTMGTITALNVTENPSNPSLELHFYRFPGNLKQGGITFNVDVVDEQTYKDSTSRSAGQRRHTKRTGGTEGKRYILIREKGYGKPISKEQKRVLAEIFAPSPDLLNEN